MDYVAAWCRPAVPQPPTTDAVWGGRTDGTVFNCVRPGFSGIPDPSTAFQRWLSVEQEAVDPLALAWRAVASMGLTAPQLGMFPKSRGQDYQAVGYVGWNMWLWVADPGPTTWGPITASASDGGYTVTATAEVDRVEWDMGNGDVVTCDQGTRHPPMAVRSEPSPDCGYIYQHDGYYTVTATTYWTVQWSGPSASGTLQLDMGRADEVAIAEAQVVNIPVDQ